MSIEELVELYPTKFATAVGAGMAVVLLCVMFLVILDILGAIVEIFCARRRAAICLGFQNGTVTGYCHCHGCPYCWQCYYYMPRRHSLRGWVKEKLHREETRCHFCKEKHTCQAFGTGVLYPCPYYEKEKKP